MAALFFVLVGHSFPLGIGMAALGDGSMSGNAPKRARGVDVWTTVPVPRWAVARMLCLGALAPSGVVALVCLGLMGGSWLHGAEGWQHFGCFAGYCLALAGVLAFVWMASFVPRPPMPRELVVLLIANGVLFFLSFVVGARGLLTERAFAVMMVLTLGPFGLVICRQAAPARLHEGFLIASGPLAAKNKAGRFRPWQTPT